MISFYCEVGIKNIFFAIIAGHDDEVTTVKLLVTEIYYARVTTVMFLQ